MNDGLWGKLEPDRPEDLESVVRNGFVIGMTQSLHEVRMAAAFVRNTVRASNVVELGTCGGGWLYVMHRMSQAGKRISCDRIWEERDPRPGLDPNFFRSAVPGLVEVYGDIHSQTSLDAVRTALNGEQIGLLFLDADHSRDGARKHVEMYGPLVGRGGWIGFHDIANGWGVGEYYRDLCRLRPHHWEFVSPVVRDGVFGIGFLRWNGG